MRQAGEGEPFGDEDALDLLGTEQARPGLEDLDVRPVHDVVGLLLSAEAEVAGALAAAHAELAAAATAVAGRLRSGGRLIYVAAGSPGRIASLDAVECAPTFGVDPATVTAVVAGGEHAVGPAFELAEDDADSGAADLAAKQPGECDAVVGVTASGRTPYVLNALAVARSKGAVTVAVTNNPDTPAARAADHAVELLTGPEVLAGSTRLTAGTAQKIALNVLSTAALVRCGRSYGAWMAGVQASNSKLRRRATRTLQRITGAEPVEAAAALDEAAGSTATALVMLQLDVGVAAARDRLQAAQGNIRTALARR